MCPPGENGARAAVLELNQMLYDVPDFRRAHALASRWRNEPEVQILAAEIIWGTDFHLGGELARYALDLAGPDLEIVVRAAYVCLETGRVDAARAALDKCSVATTRGFDWEVFLYADLLANVTGRVNLLLGGDPDVVRECLTAAYDYDPTNVNFARDLATFLWDAGNHKEAVGVIRRTLDGRRDELLEDLLRIYVSRVRDGDA